MQTAAEQNTMQPGKKVSYFQMVGQVIPYSILTHVVHGAIDTHA